MNPRTSSASCSSLINGSASVNTSTNHRSPSGSSRCNTLSRCVVNGSSGTQCTGSWDQSNRTSLARSATWSGSSNTPADSTGDSRTGSLTEVFAGSLTDVTSSPLQVDLALGRRPQHRQGQPGQHQCDLGLRRHRGHRGVALHGAHDVLGGAFRGEVPAAVRGVGGLLAAALLAVVGAD